MSSMTDTSQAVEQLWQRVSHSLHAWFEHQTRSADDADDLLQECFLRVHDRMGELKDEERLTAWIRTIARNLLTDWRRRRRPDPVEGDVAQEERATGLDEVVAAWLEGMLEELAPADREALRMTELEGVTQREAAERLGLSLSALKSRVLRARERLRQRLLACCELEFDRRGGIVAYRQRSSRRCGEC